MRMLVIGLALGLVAGLAIGRSWRPLAALSIRWFPLLLVALVARAAAPFAEAAAFPLYAAAIGGTTVVAAGNARLVGAALIAAGGALNFVIVTLNRGMPVDPAAVSMAGGTMPTDRLHVTATSQTILAALSDVIPVTPLHAAYSAGDVAIALGAFLVPFVLLIRR